MNCGRCRRQMRHPWWAIRTPSGTPEAPALRLRLRLRLRQAARPRELQALRRQIGGLGVVSSVSMSLLQSVGDLTALLTSAGER